MTSYEEFFKRWKKSQRPEAYVSHGKPVSLFVQSSIELGPPV